MKLFRLKVAPFILGWKGLQFLGQSSSRFLSQILLEADQDSAGEVSPRPPKSPVRAGSFLRYASLWWQLHQGLVSQPFSSKSRFTQKKVLLYGRVSWGSLHCQLDLMQGKTLPKISKSNFSHNKSELTATWINSSPL